MEEQPANVINAIESGILSWHSLIAIASGNPCDPSIALVTCCLAIESGLANDRENHLAHDGQIEIESAIGIDVLEIAIGWIILSSYQWKNVYLRERRGDLLRDRPRLLLPPLSPPHSSRTYAKKLKRSKSIAWIYLERKLDVPSVELSSVELFNRALSVILSFVAHNTTVSANIA